MHSLPLFHRIAGCRVVVVGDGEAAEAKRRLIERAGGIPCSEAEAHHARLAFVATENRADAAAARLRQRGLLVNVTDRPDLCDFTVPSVLDRDPVLVAVGTGGASAGLAKHLRLRLERMVPQSLGRLAKALADARDTLRARIPTAQDRRRALDVALSEGGALDPFDAQSVDRIGTWLDGADELPTTRTIEITLASDDPDDLTLRDARALGMADTVLHDAAVPETILSRARADAVRRLLPGGSSYPGLTVILRR